MIFCVSVRFILWSPWHDLFATAIPFYRTRLLRTQNSAKRVILAATTEITITERINHYTRLPELRAAAAIVWSNCRNTGSEPVEPVQLMESPSQSRKRVQNLTGETIILAHVFR